MHRFWYLLIVPVLVPVSVLGIVAGLAAVHPPLAVAPPVELNEVKVPQLPEVDSLEELYRLRDRLQAELDQPADEPEATVDGTIASPDAVLQQLQAVEIRIQVEETAEEKWAQAIQLATQAVNLKDSEPSGTEQLEEVHSLWKQAIRTLQEVPEGSFLTEPAAEKIKEYRPLLSAAAYAQDTARSGFLEPIAEKTGLGLNRVHITVCNLERECRRLNGDVPPDSPASLIKLPIAIAVMEKVTTENIDLETPIMVTESNYTEDASDIWVGKEYTLDRLLLRMINDSSNIATNQLMDYAGRDYINQVLRDRGYKATLVDHKMVGEQTYPANAGSRPNRTTTDELTEMMVQIYNFENPGDDVLLNGLVEQYDWKLGYAALKGDETFWLGEKTGQNSNVLGTTVAAKIGEEKYIITVALDRSGNERAVRNIIKDIAQHILQEGEL